ncbi:Methyltransferase-like protein 10 [Globomyces sp. JEL0801]|nr:Methyltransferase-like protein 10 [Globomyces sp. JEL0801]
MDSELNPSNWDDIYDREIENYVHSGDKGEIWFGMDSAERMVDWVEENISDKSTKILDLGCGNGHLLFLLNDLEFNDLMGIDYSKQSIDLCTNIAKDEQKSISFKQVDLLDKTQVDAIGKVNLALDKGTFDAISLASADQYQLPGTITPANQYVNAVYDLLLPKGLLLITSCNWTESELLARFSIKFNMIDKVKYPSFTFGGVSGQKVTTLIFEKKE